MSSDLMLGLGAAGVLFVIWFVAMLARRARKPKSIEVSPAIRDALTIFTEQSLELPSVEEILVFAREAVQTIFNPKRVVMFERGEGDAWEARISKEEDFGQVPTNLSGVFGWLGHNPRNALKSELGEKRFGAMRRPLSQAMTHYKLDVLMPLVERGSLMAVIGLSLSRTPNKSQRQALRLFRLTATAASLNVRLHREAAHLVTLAEEVDLASAVKLNLAPEETTGISGGMTWAGHYEAAGEANSDFWGVYPLSGGGTLVLIGDSVGKEIAGAMVSAVVKSCADSMLAEEPAGMDAGAFLSALNRSLYQPSRPAQSSCFAALIAPGGGEIRYANAGHVIPYVLRRNGAEPELGVLQGAGPLLGDDGATDYTVSTTKLGDSDALVFFSDGLLKGQNPAGSQFKERSLQQLLLQQTDSSALVIRDRIVEAVTGHRAGVPPVDDVGLVVLARRNGAY